MQGAVARHRESSQLFEREDQRSLLAALPPDVRKVFDLPSWHWRFSGLCPQTRGVAPKKRWEQQPYRTSGGKAARTKPL